MYDIEFAPEAQEHMKLLQLHEPMAFKKVYYSFLPELREYPKTGTGHPELLKGEPEGRWSRRITKKHRLIYQIRETEVLVLVLQAYGHYNDK